MKGSRRVESLNVSSMEDRNVGTSEVLKRSSTKAMRAVGQGCHGGSMEYRNEDTDGGLKRRSMKAMMGKPSEDCNGGSMKDSEGVLGLRILRWEM